jgi:hypothetical protein
LLSQLDLEVQGESIRVAYTANQAGWYQIYRDSMFMSAKYSNAGEAVVSYVPADTSAIHKQVISVLRSGDIAWDMRRAARSYDQQTSKRATLEWQWPWPQSWECQKANGSTSFGSPPSVQALISQCAIQSGTNNRATLTLSWTPSETTGIDMQLLNGTSVLAQALAVTPGGAFSLSAYNNSGCSCTGTFIDSSTTGTEVLYLRWPEYMNIYRDAALIDSVLFTGVDGYWREKADLTPGATYAYQLAALSDTGEEGPLTTALNVTISQPPLPPSGLQYHLGDANALTLSFVKSPTDGADCDIYIQAPAATYMPWNEPYPRSINYSGVSGYISVTGLTYPGVNKTELRANKSGYEEKQGTQLALEFAADGSYIRPRPNVPTINSVAVADGLTVTVNCTYDPARQDGVATHVHLYLKPNGGSYPAVPDSSASLDSEGAVYISAPTVVAPTAGTYWVKIVAATAINTESATGSEAMVFVSDVAPGAAQQPNAYPTRG